MAKTSILQCLVGPKQLLHVLFSLMNWTPWHQTEDAREIRVEWWTGGYWYAILFTLTDQGETSYGICTHQDTDHIVMVYYICTVFGM